MSTSTWREHPCSSSKSCLLVFMYSRLWAAYLMVPGLKADIKNNFNFSIYFKDKINVRHCTAIRCKERSRIQNAPFCAFHICRFFIFRFIYIWLLRMVTAIRLFSSSWFVIQIMLQVRHKVQNAWHQQDSFPHKWQKSVFFEEEVLIFGYVLW